MTPRRTEYAAFVLDLMDFIDEKILEAMENERSRVAAVGETAGAIPVLCDLLVERLGQKVDGASLHRPYRR